MTFPAYQASNITYDIVHYKKSVCTQYQLITVYDQRLHFHYMLRALENMPNKSINTQILAVNKVRHLFYLFSS